MSTRQPASSPDCPSSLAMPQSPEKSPDDQLTCRPPKPAPPLSATRTDFIFALIWSLLGYAFIYAFTTKWQHALALYIPAYAAAVLAFVYKSGLRPPKESFFWLGALLCIGLPFPYYSTFGLVQLPALLGTAAYFTLCAAGALAGGRSSPWLPLDLLNAFIVVPFGNFTGHLRVFVRGLGNTGSGKKLLAVGLGLIISIPLLGLVLPGLSVADAGFSSLMRSFDQWLGQSIGDILLRLALSLPVTAFLYGLIHGAVHRRRTALFPLSSLAEAPVKLRVLPDLATLTALCLVGGVYVIFIALQWGYLFSAFGGVLPTGFTYAGYARQGFFELCQVSAFNLLVLFLANTFSKTGGAKRPLLRGLNLAFSALSLLLLATAASKMGLYIPAFGLTQLRVLTSVFLLWLAFVFVLILVRQLRPVPLLRPALFVGTVLFCLLCVVDVNACILDFRF